MKFKSNTPPRRAYSYGSREWTVHSGPHFYKYLMIWDLFLNKGFCRHSCASRIWTSSLRFLFRPWYLFCQCKSAQKNQENQERLNTAHQSPCRYLYGQPEALALYCNHYICITPWDDSCHDGHEQLVAHPADLQRYICFKYRANRCPVQQRLRNWILTV